MIGKNQPERNYFFVIRIFLNSFHRKQELLSFVIVYNFTNIRPENFSLADKIHIKYPDARQQCLASIFKIPM
jgi:hypothetical protein